MKNHQDVPVSFADGYPFLLINEASVQELQGRCPASIKLEQFRGNLIITGAKPFEEDTWKTIQIGDVIFTLDKPCSRCILTTVSPEKGIKHPNSEPLVRCKPSVLMKMVTWILVKMLWLKIRGLFVLVIC